MLICIWHCFECEMGFSQHKSQNLGRSQIKSRVSLRSILPTFSHSARWVLPSTGLEIYCKPINVRKNFKNCDFINTWNKIYLSGLMCVLKKSNYLVNLSLSIFAKIRVCVLSCKLENRKNNLWQTFCGFAVYDMQSNLYWETTLPGDHPETLDHICGSQSVFYDVTCAKRPPVT